MKITAALQVFDCLLKVAKSNLYRYVWKPPCKLHSRATTLSSKLFARATLLYDVYYVGYAWRAIFWDNSFSGTFLSFAKCAAKGLRCFAASAWHSHTNSKWCLSGKYAWKTVARIQCCKLFVPTVPQNGRGIELQRNISAILRPFGNLITLSD